MPREYLSSTPTVPYQEGTVHVRPVRAWHGQPAVEIALGNTVHMERFVISRAAFLTLLKEGRYAYDRACSVALVDQLERLSEDTAS